MNNQNLRFDPARPHWNRMNINVNMPPYTPNIAPPIEQIRPYMGFISGVLAKRIQDNAQQNALRTTLFNLAAENSFANQYFDSMATMAIQLVAYMSKQEKASIEQFADRAAELVCDYFTAANVRQYNILTNYIESNAQMQVIKATVAEFDTVAQTLAQFVNSGFNGNGGGNNWQNNGGNTNWQTGGNNNRGNLSSYAEGQSGGGSNNSFTGSSSIFDTFTPVDGSNNASQIKSNGDNSFSQWEQSAPPPANNQQSSNNFEPQDQQEKPMELQKIEATAANWRPNRDADPYYFAYDPTTWNAYLAVGQDGFTYPDYTTKTQEEKMDYQRHGTPMIFGKPPAFVDLTAAAKTMERITAGVNQLNGEALEESDDSNVETVKTTVATDWCFATTLSEAWMLADLKRLQIDASENPLPDVYRVYARIADAIITKEDESGVVRDLGKSKSFLGLREKLNNLAGEMSPLLFNAINDRMLELVNRILVKELGLGVTISNFNDDIGEVIEHIEHKYGAAVKSAFLRDQETDICRTLQTLSEQTTQLEAGLIMAGMKFPGDVKPNITFVSSNYSLTYVDCLSWELNISLFTDMPVRVDERLTPLFFNLVKGAFLDADNQETAEQRTLSIARVLMRTRDGRVIECTRGGLAEDAYLLTLLD